MRGTTLGFSSNDTVGRMRDRMKQHMIENYCVFYQNLNEPLAVCGGCEKQHAERRADGDHIWSQCVGCYARKKQQVEEREAKNKEQEKIRKGEQRVRRLERESGVNLDEMSFQSYPIAGGETEMFLQKMAERSPDFFKGNLGMVFYGVCGIGKTTTACLIAAARCRAFGMTARYLRSSDLQYYNDFGGLNGAMTCGTLIIDEIGVGDSTPEWLMMKTADRLRRILDMRAGRKRKTILITNLGLEEPVFQKLVEPTRVRAFGKAYFQGKSVRGLKIKGKLGNEPSQPFGMGGRISCRGQSSRITHGETAGAFTGQKLKMDLRSV